jgi:undecaprenyl-diphosphatase
MIWETISYLILGIVQGLTEFLPVSSSGHLALCADALNLPENDIAFTVLVHAATALSTMVVFKDDIMKLISGETPRKYLAFLAISMIPAGIIGFTFKDQIKSITSTELVGYMLIVTAVILALSQKIKSSGTTPVGWLNSLLIGSAQAMAILPGISRSGSTIGAALMLGVSREEAARFSFLMALPVIGGATLLEAKDLLEAGTIASGESIPVMGYTLGFFAAFVSGLFACKWMIRLVKGTNLMWFAVYCLIIGLVTITLQ